MPDDKINGGPGHRDEPIVIPVTGTSATLPDLGDDVEYDVKLTDVYFQDASPHITIHTYPTGDLEPIPFFSLIDDEPGAGFGASTIVAGDLDDDGFEDLAVGAPNASHPEPFEGAAYFYSGALLFTGAPPARIETDEPLGMLGRYLAP